MTVENPRNSHEGTVGTREKLRPIDRLINASHNLVDLMGNKRDSESDQVVHEVIWDDEQGRRVELVSRGYARGVQHIRYTLKIFNQNERGDPVEIYQYTPSSHKVPLRDTNYKPVKDGDTKDTIPLLLGYIRAGMPELPGLSEEFNDIIVRNDIRSPSKVRRFAWAALYIIRGK